VTLTQSDNGNRVREPPQRKKAFGRVPLLLAWDKMGHTGQRWDTQRDIIAVRVGHGMSHPGVAASIVTLGGAQ
jgi:hypothetical protein